MHKCNPNANNTHAQQRTYTTPHAKILPFYCSIQLKKCLVGLQNVPMNVPKNFLPKKLVIKLWRFSDSAGFSCFTKLILYGYHFRQDFKIFRTIDQGRDKSRDTTRALDAEYWEPKSLPTTNYNLIVICWKS